MRFHATTERACRTAKRLRDIVNALVPSPVPLNLGGAQRALAAAWGYASWTELVQGCEGAPFSMLDEDAGIEEVARRAEAHADALARTLDVDLALSRAIVARAGLTARTPPARAGETRDRTDTFRDRDPDGAVTAFEAVISAAMASGPRMVTFAVGERVTSTKDGQREVVPGRVLDQAALDAIVSHVYGRHGLARAKSGRDLKSDKMERWALDLGPFPADEPYYSASVTARGTRVTCAIPPTDAMGKRLDRIPLGRVAATGEEASLSEKAFLHHVAVLGGDRVSRTALLRASFTRALKAGHGCVMVHTGGDAWHGTVRDMARANAREGDLDILDLSGRRRDGPGILDPFASGDVAEIAATFASLLSDEMWGGRAQHLLRGVSTALAYFAKRGQPRIDAGAVAAELDLVSLVDLTDRVLYPDMPEAIRRPLVSYLASLPGFQPEKGYFQADATYEQHSRFTGRIRDVLDVLAPHVTPDGVDMVDVIAKRRMLVVSLPGAEAKGVETGRVVLGLINHAMESIARDRAEDGGIRHATPPLRLLLDDPGRYDVHDFDMRCRLARANGISVTFTADDARSLGSLGAWGGVGASTMVAMNVREREMADAIVSGMPRVPSDDGIPLKRDPGLVRRDLADLRDGEAIVVWPDGSRHVLTLADVPAGAPAAA